jgi:hypothetical protein
MNNPSPSPQIFDRIFKTTLKLSRPAVISFINALFNTSHPVSSLLSYLPTETILPSLKSSISDINIAVNYSPYIIETQIANDPSMALRILQYILNQTPYTTISTDHLIRVSIPEARVIYWETTRSTPDKETIMFRFPDGVQQSLEVPSFKFPHYSPSQLEAMGMGIVLPFCMVKLRKELKKVKGGGGMEEWKGRLRGLVKEVVGAVERSERRGVLSRGDVLNVLRLTRHLQHELYGAYTDEAEDREMWEDIDVIDYDGMLREAEEKFAREFTQKLTREKDREIEQEKKQAARKLREMGVSDELLTAAGLLETVE